MSEPQTGRRADAREPAEASETTVPRADGPPTPSPPGWAAGQPASFPTDFGRYRLERKIGQGGMGCVYLARDAALDRPVAVKIPTVSLSENPTLRERFFREARLAATINHPNICPVFDVGCHNGVHFLVMAYIEGRPLSAFVRAGAKLPAKNVCTVVRNLALAMHEAHTRGVIHRDLKPANIMIAVNKQPVIMDFGLARRADAASGTVLTQAGVLMGTPEYMPPEQIDGDVEKIGPRTDVYALGVILYELLAGRLPFTGTTSQLITQIATQPPPSLKKFRPNVPAVLEAICLKALAKTPDGRFADMREFAAALADWIAGRVPSTVKVETGDSEIIEDVEVVGDSEAAKLFGEIAKKVEPAPRPSPLPPAQHHHEPARGDSLYWSESKPEKPPSKKRDLRRPGQHGRKKSDVVWVLTRFLAPGLVVCCLIIAAAQGRSVAARWMDARMIRSTLDALEASPDHQDLPDRLQTFADRLHHHPRLATRVGWFHILRQNDRNKAETAWASSDDDNCRATTSGSDAERGDAWWRVGLHSTGEAKGKPLWTATEYYLRIRETPEYSPARQERVRRARLFESPFRQSPPTYKHLLRDYAASDRPTDAAFAVQLELKGGEPDLPCQIDLGQRGGDKAMCFEWLRSGQFSCHVFGRKLATNGQQCRHPFPGQQSEALLLVVTGGVAEVYINNHLCMYPVALPRPVDSRGLEVTFAKSEARNRVDVKHWSNPVHKPKSELLEAVTD